MVKITRLWDIADFDLNAHIEILFKRPRIDYRISEYVIEFINKNILEPNKVMQTGNYDICISLDFYYPDEQKYFEDSPYNTEISKFDSEIKNTTENGIKFKMIHLFCFSTTINETLNPKEYANIVYDMVGSFLIKNYKKITKDIMEKHKKEIDYKIIEQYKYPALFEEQKYLFDDENDGMFVIDDETI